MLRQACETCPIGNAPKEQVSRTWLAYAADGTSGLVPL